MADNDFKVSGGSQKNIRKHNIDKTEEITGKNYRWWVYEGKELSNAVFATVLRIDQDKSRLQLNVRNASLYASGNLSGNDFLAGVPKSIGNIPNYNGNIKYNVIKSNIDTVVSKLGKNKPMIMYLTDGGSWDSKVKAENLTNYMFGSFGEMKIYNKGRMCLRDAGILGDGVLAFYENYIDKRVDCERVLINEIKVDKSDALYGNPRSKFRLKYLQRDVVLSKYPKYADAILSAMSEQLVYGDSSVDMIPVVEGWHLPDNSDAKNGKHCICIEGVTVFEEEYTKDYYPFAYIKWSKPISGFYGESIADELEGMQREIDSILRNISRAHRLVGIPRVWLHTGANVSPSRISNVIADIIEYSGPVGAKPIFETPTAMNAETYNYLYWLIKASYEKTGVSVLSATSQKPAGVDAAIAMRTMQEIESERFQDVSQDYEQFYLDAAEIVFDMSKDMDKRLKEKGDGGLLVKIVDAPNSADKNSMETIEFSEIDLDRDRFIQKAWPVNILPKSPVGRLAKVQELIQAGMVDPVKGQQLLNAPDLKGYESLEFAARNLVDKLLYRMLYKGEYQPPEKEFDLEYCMYSAQQMYLYGKLYKAKEKNLMLCLRFMDESERLRNPPEIGLDNQPAALPVAQPIEPIEPMANPLPPPVNELIPNLPI